MTVVGVLIWDTDSKKAQLVFKMKAGSAKSPDIIDFLKKLKAYLKGKKILLVWDGLPAHRSKMVKVYIQEQRSWLMVVRYPGYAPGLNPIEYVWGAIKKKDIGGIAGDRGLSHVMKQVQKGKRRMQKDQEILRGCMKASGLFREKELMG